MADWGSVPEWVGGLGSAGAFAVALWLLRTEALLRRKDRTAEESRQARLVLIGPLRGRGPGADDVAWDVEAEVVNNSSMGPVFELEAELWYGPSNKHVSVEPVVLEQLNSMERKTLEWKHLSDPYLRRDKVSSELTVVLSFTDTDGRRWTRRGWGSPVRLGSGANPTP